MGNDRGNRNITLSFPRSLLKKAKILAASLDKSLSQLVREALESRLAESGAYKNARARQLKYLKQGFDLGTGGIMSFSREQVHER